MTDTLYSLFSGPHLTNSAAALELTFCLAGHEGRAQAGVGDHQVALQGHAKEAAAAQGTLAGWALLLVDIDDAGEG